MDVLAGNGVEKRRVELAPDASANGFSRAIDGRLHGRVVSRLGTPAHGSGVAENHAVCFRNQQPMPSRLGKLRKPLAALVEGFRFKVERRGRMDDVVVIDSGQTRQIVEGRLESEAKTRKNHLSYKPAAASAPDALRRRRATTVNTAQNKPAYKTQFVPIENINVPHEPRK